jgi:circadian clock protein KaiC
MLGGGLLAGCAAVVAGSPGTGKTLLGLQFLAEGLRRGEPGVLLSIEEDPDRIVQFGHGIGLDLGGSLSSGALRIVYQLPVELATDEILWNLRQAVRETKARRVVIDSLSSLFRHVMPDPILAQDYARGLLDLLREAEATCTLNWELPEITGDLTISDQGISALADTVLVMRFVETASEVHRVLGVLKMRGSNHEKELRAYRITDQGLQIQAKLHGLSGVLSGSATGTLKEAVEEILQPLTFIHGSAAILLQEELEEEARRQLLTEIQAQADHLTREVCRFLDYELPSG